MESQISFMVMGSIGVRMEDISILGEDMND